MFLYGIMYDVSYMILQIPLVIVRFVLHLGLTLFSKAKHKRVLPGVKNPTLLKSATALARDIREGKIKSEDVVQAYVDRIQEVEPYINATADYCFLDAFKKAKEVDALIASGKYSKDQLFLKKPLLGVPVSIKCVFHVKNMPCTAGSCLFSDLKATDDAPAVASLKNAGAIVIATTNVPELGMDMETSNKIYGRACNPYDTRRTCGGSSGGEGALISAAASVLGLGNDLLGSLRIPAHFTGIFAHKPSRGLVSNHGTFPYERPDDRAKFCNPNLYKYLASGPMCRYAEDLNTSMKALVMDNALKTRFDSQIDFKKLKICYLTEIRSPLVLPVNKDIASGLQKAVSYFKKQCDIAPKEVKMPYLYDINRCVISVMVPLLRDMKATTIGHKGLGLNEKMEFVKCLSGKSKQCFRTFINLNGPSLLYSESQSTYYHKMIEALKSEFNKLLDENTVLLMPTLPVTAPFHSESNPVHLSCCYMSLFNVLGLPATHCPIGFTKEGLPYGIQIVGCQNNDPLTIACAVELEKEFGGWKPC